jgi:ribosomal protein S25
MERRDREELEKWRSEMEVEETGIAVGTDEERARREDEIVHVVQDEKVVQLEDIAGRWDLRTSEVLELLARLEENGRIHGVVDERGLYIYITKEELRAVADFVRHKGRVKISALATQSNKLIKLDV